MIPVIYPPNDSEELENFEEDYFSVLLINEEAIDEFLKESKIEINGLLLTTKKLVLLKFEELLEIESELVNYCLTKNKADKGRKKINPFEELFNYSNNQPRIANFFMQQKSLELRTCHYCNIDYINAFTDLQDYNGALDLLNNADFSELQLIYGVGEKSAKKIIDKRLKMELNISDVSVNLIQRTQGLLSQKQPSHNHFTLDHFLPQKTHKFFSLCLYNFVPSCYACNSKFKKDKNFKVDSDLKYVSPTSTAYSFSKDFKFKLFYVDGKLKDFKIKHNINKNVEHVSRFSQMFKILGRYIYHKDLAIKLRKIKTNYPDSKIEELSKITGISKLELKKMVFGEELFEDSMNNHSLIKFRKDIAKELNII